VVAAEFTECAPLVCLCNQTVLWGYPPSECSAQGRVVPFVVFCVHAQRFRSCFAAHPSSPPLTHPPAPTRLTQRPSVSEQSHGAPSTSKPSSVAFDPHCLIGLVVSPRCATLMLFAALATHARFLSLLPPPSLPFATAVSTPLSTRHASPLSPLSCLVSCPFAALYILHGRAFVTRCRFLFIGGWVRLGALSSQWAVQSPHALSNRLSVQSAQGQLLWVGGRSGAPLCTKPVQAFQR